MGKADKCMLLGSWIGCICFGGKVKVLALGSTLGQDVEAYSQGVIGP